jgi:hypothetical protein
MLYPFRTDDVTYVSVSKYVKRIFKENAVRAAAARHGSGAAKKLQAGDGSARPIRVRTGSRCGSLVVERGEWIVIHVPIFTSRLRAHIYLNGGRLVSSPKPACRVLLQS